LPAKCGLRAAAQRPSLNPCGAGRRRLCCRQFGEGRSDGIGLQSGFVIGVVLAALLLADRLGGSGLATNRFQVGLLTTDPEPVASLASDS